MMDFIAGIEVIVLLALFCTLSLASLVCLIVDRIKESRKEKTEKVAWYDYSDLKREVESIKRDVEKLQSK